MQFPPLLLPERRINVIVGMATKIPMSDHAKIVNLYLIENIPPVFLLELSKIKSISLFFQFHLSCLLPF